MSAREPPAAVTAHCPGCDQDSVHTVLSGKMGVHGESVTIDVTARCEECGRVHHVLLREAKDVDVPAIVSVGNGSRRTTLPLPSDGEVELEEAFIVDGMSCKLTGIESKEMKRVDAAAIKDVRTLWLKSFDEVAVGFAINLGHKTIAKSILAKAEDEFTVGDEHLFGRLRVTVHAIKTKERLLKRGSAEAAEIVRVFAKPTPLGDFTPRPDKRTREALREREGRGR